MANFDLFSYARGAEYAKDQNQQDEDNAFKRQQNEMSLSSFEKQLKAYDDQAPLRQQNYDNALTKGALLKEQLADQSGYQSMMQRARAVMPTEVRDDASPQADFSRAVWQQNWMRDPLNKVDPKHFEAFRPQFAAARGGALDRSQQDPVELNRLLQHSAFGSRYQVALLPSSKPDNPQYQLLQATQVPSDADSSGEMTAYMPVPNVTGPLQVITSTLRAQFSRGVNPDLGFTAARADEAMRFQREQLYSANERANFNAAAGANHKQGSLGTRQDEVDQRATAAAAKAAQSAATAQAKTRTDAAKYFLNQLSGAKKELATLTKPGADVRAKAAAEQAVSRFEELLKPYAEELQQLLSATPAFVGQQPTEQVP